MSEMERAELLKEWLKHKKAEDSAKKKRNDIESLIELSFGAFDGDSKTFTEGDYKVNVKKNIVQKLDQEKYLAIRDEIPEDMRPEKITFSIHKQGFDWLKENEPAIYRKVSDCVEEKANKTTIKVEKI